MESREDLVRSRAWLCAIIVVNLMLALFSVLDSGAEVKSPVKQETWFSAAHCNGSIAKTEWKLTDAHSPTPACMIGKNVTKGVLDFDDNENESAIVPLTLPQHFTGTITVNIMWEPASSIGSVGWCVELLSSADLNRDGGAPIRQTARHCASQEAKTVAHHVDKALVLNVVATAPAANSDVLHLRVSRDANSSVVLDDMPGDARLIGVRIDTQEVPRQTS